MGLLKGIVNIGNNILNAGKTAVESAVADQWKEFFYCDSLDNNTLMVRGQKRISSKSSNTAGSDNIITNGSGIVVNEGQAMIIVDQGKIVEFCAEPGQFTWNASTEPSIFAGKLGTSILDTFKTIGKRFTYGGDIPKDQRVYYFNTKDILDNKFGTQTPIIFRVVDKKINLDTDVQLRCNGTFIYKIENPLLFYSKLVGNRDIYTKDLLAVQMKNEFIDALQPALGRLSDQEIRPSEISREIPKLKEAINQELQEKWKNERGIVCSDIAMNPPSLTEEDQKKLTDAQFEGRYTDVNQAAAGLAAAQMQAMKDAANNSAGAMTGFLGMGFAQQQGGGANAASLFQMAGQQNAANAAAQQAAPATENAPADAWKCPKCGASVTGKFCTECGEKKPEGVDGWVCPNCGQKNKGKFCQECGTKKPAGEPIYACDKCGWKPEDPKNPPKFCPECGDPFDDSDIVK